jgi:cytochrome c oxidase subunit I+III
MVGLLAVLTTVLGTLVFCYFYLRLYSQQWPQAGLPLPQLSAPLVSFGMLLGSGIAQALSSWAWRRNHRLSTIFGMFAATILGVGFIAGELVVLLLSPFLPSANAYASVFFAIDGFVLLMALTGIALQIGTLARVLRKGEPLDTPRLKLWLQNSEMFWFFAVASGLIGFLVIYLTPYVL